jgi:hypothetical protein
MLLQGIDHYSGLLFLQCFFFFFMAVCIHNFIRLLQRMSVIGILVILIYTLYKQLMCKLNRAYMGKLP